MASPDKFQRPNYHSRLIFAPNQNLNYMKQLFVLSLFALLACIPGTAMAQQKAEWKEMHDFHKVMGASFHPAEEGNLKPLRENADLLVERALAWQKSAVPAGYDAKASKGILKRLVKQCKVVRKSVKANASDKVLTEQITVAHDIFHELMEVCAH